MIDSRENIELIEKHLSQSLSGSEKDLFNKKMQDPEFVQLVEDLSFGQGLLLEMSLLDKKQALNEFIETKNKEKKSSRRKRILISTLIGLAIVGGGIFGYKVFKSTIDEKVAHENEKVEQENKQAEEPKALTSPDLSNREQENRMVTPTSPTVLQQGNKEPNEITDSTQTSASYDSTVIVVEKDTVTASTPLAMPDAKDEKNEADNNISKQKTCNDLVLPSFQIQNSCSFRGDGVISWTDLGDHAIIYEEESLETSELRDLSDGNYAFIVKSDFCNKDTTLVIKNSPCFSAEDYVLQKDHKVTIEFSGISSGEIIILDKWNREMFRSRVENELYEWDGYGTNGNQLDIGLYYVLIKGFNNQFIKAELTIVP